MSTSERVTIDGFTRSVLDNLLEGCQVIGFDWTYLYLNEVAAAQARRPREQLLDRSMIECYPGIDQTAMFEHLRRCMADRTQLRMENEFTHADGSREWFELRFVPVSEGVCIFSLNVTENRLAEEARRRTEEALRASEGRFNAFMDTATMGAWMQDEQGRFVYVNKAWEQTMGLSREQALGRTAFELLPPAVAQKAHDAEAHLLATGQGSRVTVHAPSPTGQDRWFQITHFPIRDASGARYVGGITVDMTAEKQMEAGLRLAEENLRLLIDGVPDYSILRLDPDGHIATWNHGSQRLLGYTEEEILGSDYQRLYPPEDVIAGQPAPELAVALSQGRAEHEGWRVRKDGTRFWAHAIVTPLFDPSGRHVGFAKVTRDLTEPRKLEEQLRQAQKLDAIGSLAGGVAHDFNNLLSVILSYSQLLAESLQPDDPMRADLEEIRAAGQRAADLTHQLLAFGRKQILQPRAMNLNDVVAGTERMLRRLVGEDIEVTFLPAPDLGIVKVDRGQIEQVVVNLVVNARDAMPLGGKLTIETDNVELSEAYAEQHVGVAPGPHVMIAVSDTGLGMDEATRARMFEPFFTTKERGKGTGLGLSTVFGIVRQSGGHIWVYSEPGNGTTLKVYFPRTDDIAADIDRASAPTRSRRGTETILLVEDDERVRLLVRNILQRNGYHVLEAQSGGDALLICEQYGATIHLMVTDVIMPRMSGRQLAERLKPVRPAMKVLYMSGYTDNSIVHHGVLDSGVAFLQKPITPEKLTRKVREVLDNPSEP
jgi:PAS domain S-box-containing protein